MKYREEKLRKQPYVSLHRKEQKPGINLPKEGKDMYSEAYETVMKEIEGDTNRWKDKLSSWTGRINIVKITYYSGQSTFSMQSLSKYHLHFLQN